MTDERYDASDPKKVKAARKKEKFIDKTYLNDMKYILSLKQGRRLIWKYMENAGIFRTSFTGNSTTFFNEGRRDIGLQILADVMAADPDKYILMSKESEELKNG